ncbi:MAG: Spy/CpxP family protein refolding chaperone [Terracidiphilus sp.]
MLMAAPTGAQGVGAGQGMSGGMGHGVGQGFDAHRPPFERAFRFRGTDGSWWNNPRIAAALKLTGEQRKAMDEIMYAHREKLIDLEADMERADLAMQPLMNADTPDQAAIEGQIDRVVAARAALEKANANFLLDIRMKLTPDQWKQVKAFRAHGGGMHGMHGEMHGPQGRGAWGHGEQRPGGQYHPGGEFHRPMPPSQNPQQAPPASTAPPAGSGTGQ